MLRGGGVQPVVARRPTVAGVTAILLASSVSMAVRVRGWLVVRAGHRRIINDATPASCEAKLENLSYAEGASRKGKTLDEHCQIRKMRMECSLRTEAR